jgi:hypothetical protein
MFFFLLSSFVAKFFSLGQASTPAIANQNPTILYKDSQRMDLLTAQSMSFPSNEARSLPMEAMSGSLVCALWTLQGNVNYYYEFLSYPRFALY